MISTPTVYAPLSEREEEIGKFVVESALAVHRALGPGLMEKVYEVCFCHEITKRGLIVERQVVVPILYDGIVFEEGLRCDVFVERLVVCELKAVDEYNPVWDAQLLSYLKMTSTRLGYRINFNVSLIKDGIRRMIN